MYTLAEGMANVWADPTTVVIAAFLTYGFGFLQYGDSMWMQVRNKSCPFYFWMHAWYFGHDFTFSIICWYQWWYVAQFWLFEVLAIGCIVFMGIEIFSLYQTVKNERQEVWGKYLRGKKVSVGYAWGRGICGYIIGVLFFQSIRVIIGDPMCLVLMSSTNAILAMMTQLRFSQVGHYQPGMKFLAIFTLLGTCFTFAPAGIGFFTTVINPLNTPFYFVIGAICILMSIRAIYLAWTLPKLDTAPAEAQLEGVTDKARS
ncbi:MAG: hypothetical protein LUB61_06820 [Eggerthellaceae bacterium]|nr:hypothetical protein [Eggerthellaceae bacterium]